jgi:signal transduction histidine kinase
MHTSIQYRLSLNTLLVTLVGMALAGGLAWLSVGNLYLETQRENMLAQAEAAALALQGGPIPAGPVEPYSQAANVAPGLHTRLLSEEGAVAFSLPLPPGALVQVPPAENAGYVSPAELSLRPEIQHALSGRSATAIRRIASAGGRRVLYAAAPVYSTEGQVVGIVYVAAPLPAGGLPPQVLGQLAGALLAAALLAGLTGALLARHIARPLHALARAADDVAAGRLDRRVPEEGGAAELVSLGRAFNEMTGSLRRSELSRNAFVADVTHELRTPLTVIKGTIETLEDGALDDRAGRGPLLASMGRETERLIRLVDDLLVLARADSGALKLDLQQIDLAGLARQRCELLAPLAARRRVKLRVLGPRAGSRSEACARGDPDRLAQVLDNLLDNAVRYSPNDSTVTVTLQREGAEIRCEIRDRGPGIPSEHLPFIFERFYRAEADRSRKDGGGAGLGLAIVRALIQAQGGRAEAASQPGRGTAITFHLPADPDCHPAD